MTPVQVGEGYLQVVACRKGYFRWNNTCIACSRFFQSCDYCGFQGEKTDGELIFPVHHSANATNATNSTIRYDFECLECSIGFYWDNQN
jgi:hypothetical protein